MKIRIITLLTVCFATIQLSAWDEVTHAYMTRMIPQLIEDKDLKDLLERNLDEFIYGCWYTDTYQYTQNKKDRITKLNPHFIATYGEAFCNYLRTEEVQQQDNYEKLVALYLGSLSHLLEDFWYDSNLHAYQVTKDDKFMGDSRHGAFVAKQYGYIGLKVKRYFPKEDLFKMYHEAGMLEEEYDTLSEFEQMMNDWSTRQYLLLRSLKFINFLGGNQMRNQSPWTAANLEKTDGGMLNSAEVAAKFIEARWKILTGKEHPGAIHANYFDFENKVVILTSVPLELSNINPNKIILTSEQGNTIEGQIKQYAHPDKKKGITNYAFAFHPYTDLKKDVHYQLSLLEGALPDELTHKSFLFSFKPGTYKEKSIEPKPFTSTIGLGIFGFVPLAAFAGLFFGLSGLVKFNWSYKYDKRRVPLRINAIRRILELVAVALVCFAFYVLYTRGAIILEMAL